MLAHEHRHRPVRAGVAPRPPRGRRLTGPAGVSSIRPAANVTRWSGASNGRSRTSRGEHRLGEGVGGVGQVLRPENGRVPVVPGEVRVRTGRPGRRPAVWSQIRSLVVVVLRPLLGRVHLPVQLGGRDPSRSLSWKSRSQLLGRRQPLSNFSFPEDRLLPDSKPLSQDRILRRLLLLLRLPGFRHPLRPGVDRVCGRRGRWITSMGSLQASRRPRAALGWADIPVVAVTGLGAGSPLSCPST